MGWYNGWWKSAGTLSEAARPAAKIEPKVVFRQGAPDLIRNVKNKEKNLSKTQII